jgi:hypothetical protein
MRNYHVKLVIVVKEEKLLGGKINAHDSFCIVAIGAGGLLGATKTSAAVTCDGAIDKAAADMALVSTAKCPIVRRCGYFGGS